MSAHNIFFVSYRHSNGHGWLCDGVHGGRDERSLQSDLPGQRWCQVLRDKNKGTFTNLKMWSVFAHVSPGGRLNKAAMQGIQ